ncbi:hypothetical protein M407DRAFT_22557 [Tulasnella calospora MUT 4182]|uniref:Protein CPL1-like domain-containing protein n=1 Tax=Tulasnella calospora MUT 4182 TaxID=1051891 RepID=A0A0C3QMS2_9AGAM|nr:hypothetical protein M407DRAFT_22557 [Tulasnella calospora MUT 4182]
MRFRAPAIVLAALLVQSAWSISNCPAGNYLTNTGGCAACHTSTISTNANSPYCTGCPAGQTNNDDHTQCVDCPDGSRSTAVGSLCRECPAGQESTSDHKSCQKCSPGKFNPTLGAMCQECPAGQFNNVSGAKSCCDCCAGWYTSSKGSTSCTQCSQLEYNPPTRYGPVGSNSSGNCQVSKGTLPDYTTTCNMVASNSCPSTTPGGPRGSLITRKRRDMQCPNGFDACSRYSGRGGFDCVDTQSDPESCGGCVGLDGKGTGTDCTAIKGVSVTRCVKRSCVIDSCRKGWVKSLGGASCVLVSHTTASSELGGSHAQDTDAKKRRSPAKRAIRTNIY